MHCRTLNLQQISLLVLIIDFWSYTRQVTGVSKQAKFCKFDPRHPRVQLTEHHPFLEVLKKTCIFEYHIQLPHARYIIPNGCDTIPFRTRKEEYKKPITCLATVFREPTNGTNCHIAEAGENFLIQLYGTLHQTTIPTAKAPSNHRCGHQSLHRADMAWK